MKSPLKILIIEDSAADAGLLAAELRRGGFDPEWKCLATEADFSAEIKKLPALILCDYSMPELNGLRALELLRESGLDIPFIMVSGKMGESIAVGAMKLGATDYLLKDQLLQLRLVPAVRRALQEVEERAARRDLEQEKVLQTTVLKMAANAIFITNADGVIQWINPAFTALTGYAESAAIGQTPRILKSGKQNPAFYESLWRTILAGEIWRGEITNRRQDGGLYFGEETITPVRSVGGKITHFIGILNDVTERKRLAAQFIEAQKMEVIGQLAGGVAHDFNNILAVVTGYSDMLTADLGADSHLGKYAEEIRHASERAVGLTRQLLVFSRKQVVQPVVLALNEVVQDLDKMLRRLVEENIEFTMALGEETGRVKADAGYIGQLLMNLVVNARDAMPNGGRLTIASGNVTLDESHTLPHPDTRPGHYVMLSVTDTGTGMTDEVKSHLFEAFFTTKPAGKGTGLGLATCQTIIQQCVGHISVSSELGKGSTFRIYFPRVDQPLAAASPPAPSGALPHGSETLLVVEDERAVRHLARTVLQARGYEVLTAVNGQDGMRVAQEHKGSPIRLVITDVVMPLMGGKVMTEWLKTTCPDLKILFTSGYSEDPLEQDAKPDPGTQFLAKPYSPASLAAKVREMLDQETAIAGVGKPAAPAAGASLVAREKQCAPLPRDPLLGA